MFLFTCGVAYLRSCKFPFHAFVFCFTFACCPVLLSYPLSEPISVHFVFLARMTSVVLGFKCVGVLDFSCSCLSLTPRAGSAFTTSESAIAKLAGRSVIHMCVTNQSNRIKRKKVSPGVVYICKAFTLGIDPSKKAGLDFRSASRLTLLKVANALPLYPSSCSDSRHGLCDRRGDVPFSMYFVCC